MIRYEVHYQRTGGGQSGAPYVPGASNTYTEIGSLTNGSEYSLWVKAVDYSNNKSDDSAVIQCIAQPIPDSTVPQLNVQAPVSTGTYSTTLAAVTFSGTAQDSGNNLSRVKVYNATTGGEPIWDYSLSGGTHDFRVENVALGPGDNSLQVTAYENANNPSTTTTITVRRETQVLGAVIIVAGHKEAYSLQTNIDNSANRAYRIFRGAGFTKDQFRQQLITKLSEYIQGEVKISLTVISAVPQKVTVIGPVTRQENYPLSTEVTLLEAISMAGGVTAESDLRAVRILRGGLSAQPIEVDLEYYMEIGSLESAPIIRPGDVIYVPRNENLIRELSMFMRDVIFVFGFFEIFN